MYNKLLELEARLDSLDPLDYGSADLLMRDAMALARTLFTSESQHVSELERVHFRPQGVTYNTGHYMNRVAWNEAVERSSRVLHSMKYELQLSKMQSAELAAPQKVTLRWLVRHVSLTLWLSLATAAIFLFALGFTAAKIEFFNQLITLIKSLLAQ